MICPPAAAFALARAWPAVRLEMIAKAGHALSEPGITAALVRAMDALGEREAPLQRRALP
jgi:proline iminopeptidase